MSEQEESCLLSNPSGTPNYSHANRDDGVKSLLSKHKARRVRYSLWHLHLKAKPEVWPEMCPTSQIEKRFTFQPETTERHWHETHSEEITFLKTESPPTRYFGLGRL